MNQVAISVALVLCAAVLGLLGNWGRRRGQELVPPGLSAEDQRRQERVIRRGALACFVAATLFLVAAVGSLV